MPQNGSWQTALNSLELSFYSVTALQLSHSLDPQKLIARSRLTVITSSKFQSNPRQINNVHHPKLKIIHILDEVFNVSRSVSGGLKLTQFPIVKISKTNQAISRYVPQRKVNCSPHRRTT